MTKLLALCVIACAPCTFALVLDQESSLPSNFEPQTNDSMGPLTKLLYCKQYPLFCEAPFHCENAGPFPLKEIANKDGTPNLQSWCSFHPEMYYNYMSTCISKKDLKTAAQIQYDTSAKLNASYGVLEMDGSYCFIEGHCTNEAVTDTTTVEEASKMCDDRFGHDAWTKDFTGLDGMRFQGRLARDKMKGAKYGKDGFVSTAQTEPFLKMACAMGNYHCDVMYCKETYCKDEYYINKYSHFLPSVPGHLLTQRGDTAKLEQGKS